MGIWTLPEQALRSSLAFKTCQDRSADLDPVTRLLNCDKLRTEINGALQSLSDESQVCAAMHIDLERFKQIADAFGMRVGDRLLHAVGQRLERTFSDPEWAVLPSVGQPYSDVVLSRVSAKGFVAFVPHLHKVVSIDRVASLARRVISALSHPISVDGHELFITVSVGIAIGSSDGAEADTLLRHAELAMCQARQRGGSTYDFFSSQMSARSLERQTLGNQLRQAVECEQLALYYQPKVDINTQCIAGAEALLRWEHPELGVLTPDSFMPMAEELELTVEIGQWVFRTASRQAEEWSAAGLPPLSVAVNVSAAQFRQRKIWHGVRAALERSGLAPERLILEVTESMLMENADESTELLQELKQMGVKIAIDDFGTGYSSFAYLGRFPIDEVKIDRSFIKSVPGERHSTAIVSAIVALSKEMNFNVVAEGVDDSTQLSFLRALGCQQYQGYLCSRPVPGNVFMDLVRKMVVVSG